MDINTNNLPEFEVEIDITKMSQEEINKFVVNQLVTITKMIKPIAKTYDTATTVSRWIMGAAVFITVTLGAFYAVSQAFNKK